MTHNISQIINYGQIPHNIHDFYGECENSKMRLWHYAAENFCSNCKSFVCDFCISKNMTKCGVCATIIKDRCGICDCKIFVVFCQKCNSQIYYCDFDCPKNLFEFSSIKYGLYCSQECAK